VLHLFRIQMPEQGAGDTGRHAHDWGLQRYYLKRQMKCAGLHRLSGDRERAEHHRDPNMQLSFTHDVLPA
jgi:hypothetical protein